VRKRLKTQATKAKNGFTLVELSIVIVIIGLIVAGVVGGQSLIKQAQLRSISTKTNEFIVAINTFKLEYDAIPGDMSNAHNYWGNNCDTTPSRCNGDGNGAVFWGNQGGGFILDNESLRFTQHLSLAGLIKGNYSPLSAGVNACTPGITHVELLKNSAIEIGNASDPNRKFTYIDIAGYIGASNACWGAFLTPREMYSIDSKMDDGLPDSGKLKSWTGGGSTNGCVNANEYNIAFNTIECAGGISIMGGNAYR